MHAQFGMEMMPTMAVVYIHSLLECSNPQSSIKTKFVAPSTQ